MKKFQQFKWDISIISLDKIREFIDSYWEDVMEGYSEEEVIQIIFKVEYEDNKFRSFSRLIKSTNNSKFKQVLFDNVKWYILNNLSHYDQLQVKSIIISYVKLDHNIYHDSNSKILTFINQSDIKPVLNSELDSESHFKDYDFLPYTFGVTMFLKDWSSNITFNNGHRYAHFNKDSFLFTFKIFSNYYVSTVYISDNNSTVLKFKDILSEDNVLPLPKLLKASMDQGSSERMTLSSFTRVIYKKGADNSWSYEYIKYFYNEGMLVKTIERIIDERMKLSKKFPKDSKENTMSLKYYS